MSERDRDEKTARHRDSSLSDDYGDNWEHEIELEKISEPKPITFYPVCLDGERAYPPEDVGGVTGYADLLGIIQDPEHE